MDDLKECFLEVVLPIMIVTAFILLIVWGAAYGWQKYSAWSFERNTGLEAFCNITLDCYVKDDGKFIPYKVWELKNSGTYNVKLEK